MSRGQTSNVAVATLTVLVPVLITQSPTGDAHLSSFLGGSVLVVVLVEVVCDVLVVVTVLVVVRSDVLVVVVWASAEKAVANTIPTANTIILLTGNPTRRGATRMPGEPHGSIGFGSHGRMLWHKCDTQVPRTGRGASIPATKGNILIMRIA